MINSQTKQVRNIGPTSWQVKCYSPYYFSLYDYCGNSFQGTSELCGLSTDITMCELWLIVPDTVLKVWASKCSISVERYTPATVQKRPAFVKKKSSTWSDLAAYSIVLEDNQKQKGVQDWLGGFHITLEPQFFLYCVCLIYLLSFYSEDFPHDALNRNLRDLCAAHD